MATAGNSVFVSVANPALRGGVVSWLERAGYHAEPEFRPGRSSLAVVEYSPDLSDGLAPLRLLRARDTLVPVLLLASAGCEHVPLEALHLGVSDCLGAPFDGDTFIGAVGRYANPIAEAGLSEFLGGSAPARAIRDAIVRVAAAPCNVLVTGETGTGKELTASLVHRLSRRRLQPFVCLNCAAVPETLLESELFGYERGAFTGASAANPGKLQSADGGTVFLDEIGDLSLSGQAKLLRVLESGEIHRLGASRAIRIDVRIVAATHRDLESMCRSGAFRFDLFYRLNVARLHLLPLRDRPEDVPPLVAHYLGVLSASFGRQFQGVTPAAMELLLSHPWPGNVRELRNVLESAFVHAPGPFIEASDLPFHSRISGPDQLPVHGECDRVKAALAQTHWNVTRAAGLLQWSRMTVYRKIAQYGLARSAPPEGDALTIS
jgi:DNA-binding NtrC family response regulator